MMARKPAAAAVVQVTGGQSVDIPPATIPTIEALRQKARTAFNAAYARANAPGAGDDWQRVEERWQELGQAVLAARRMAEGANPNSAADHAGRLNDVRALNEATAWFDAYQPPRAPRPIVNHGLVFAHHATSPGGAGEHWIETKDRLEREAERAQAA